MRVTFAFLLIPCLAGLAAGQSLIVTPPQLSFTVPAGVQNSATQSVTIMPDPQTPSTTVSFAVDTVGAPWLRVNTTNSGLISNVTQAGVTLAVNVDTQGLTSGQTYNGIFTVQIPSVPSSQKVVNVSLLIGGASALFGTPSSLQFSAVQESTIGSPISQNVTIASTSTPFSFSLTSQTQTGGDWLLISSTGGLVGAPSASFSVSVVPTALMAGTYAGTITAQSTTTADQIQIPVTLTVTASASLTVAPTLLPPFLYQIGTNVPAPQTVVASSNGTPINFTVEQSPGTVPWLVVSPQAGAATSTGAAISLSLNPSGLPASAGTYATNVIVTPSGGDPLPPIPVTLVVSNNPILQVSPTSLTYQAPFAGPFPADQAISVSVKGAAVGFTVTSDSPWLSVSASGNVTPATLQVHVNTTGLPVGADMGTLTLRPTNSDNYSIPIPVTLNVNNPLQLTAAPSTLLFSFQTNQNPPAAQTFQVQSTGLPVQFTVVPSTSNCGTNWLQASAAQNVTPVIVTVQVVTTGFTRGLCNGSLTVNFAGAIQPLIVPVTVAVSTGSGLSISQPIPFGNEVVSQNSVGSVVITRTVSLTSTDPNSPVNFNAFATTSSGGAWLSVGPGTGSTPQNLQVTITPGGLTPGVYGGQVQISSNGLPAGLPNGQYVLPVMLTVNPNVTVTANPLSLVFAESQGGAAPASQGLTLTSSAGLATYTATVIPLTGGNWLGVNPASGNASGPLTVSVTPNSLPASATPYTAQIALAFQKSSSAPVTIPVSLTVTNPATISVSQQSLSFNFPIGGSTPAQSIVVSNAAGPVQFSVGTTSTPSGWLLVDSSSGTTPKTLNVSVNPQGLTAGTYTGSVTITTSGSSAPAQTVNITLVLAAAQPPQPTSITSNSSNLTGAIAPGELITIKGMLLGPASAPNSGLFGLNAQGTVNATLDGVQIMFDNFPGTPIYVSPAQINVTAPWEIAGQASTKVTVIFNGISSASTTVPVTGVAPALYTLNSTGSGQAAALNQDGSFNGPAGSNAGSKPASANTIISLYGTGGGITFPASTTGSVSPSNQLLLINGPVSATIGGKTATVQFIGAAPGLITGILQINLVVPAGVTGDNLPVAVTIDGVVSPSGPTVAVQ